MLEDAKEGTEFKLNLDVRQTKRNGINIYNNDESILVNTEKPQ